MAIRKSKNAQIPVTILSGFLGSGKTTLLKRILESDEHKMKIAIIVNDMAEINIDAAAVLESGLVQAKKEVISLQNGCICCTLRGDLIREINRIQELGEYDYVVIESTGIAEPQEVAESFCADPDTAELAEDPSKMLWNVARLDTCVTMVDALDFPRQLLSLKRFKDEFKDGLEDEQDAEGEKSIANLLVEQVEFANTIVLNKIDLVSPADQEAAIQLIRSLNPKAEVVPADHANVALNHILNTKRFDMKEAESSAGWLVSLTSKQIHSELKEYGVSSFVYRAKKPFHPNRLFHWIQRIFCFVDKLNKLKIHDEKKESTDPIGHEFGQIFRSKGLCWIAGRDNLMGSWAQSGRIINVSPMTPWYALLPEEEWDTEGEDEIENIRMKFEGKHGDRKQEIVFIGSKLKAPIIVASLDECLLTDEEMETHSYFCNGRYVDRLPPWIVHYDSPGIVSTTLRHGQPHKYQVAEGLQLTFSNFALDFDLAGCDDESLKPIAKIWLDTNDDQRQTLLATLRPVVCDQYALSITIPGCDEDGHATLRVDLQWLGMKRPLGADLPDSVAVHVTGTILVNDCGEKEMGENEQCTLED